MQCSFTTQLCSVSEKTRLGLIVERNLKLWKLVCFSTVFRREPDKLRPCSHLVLTSQMIQSQVAAETHSVGQLCLDFVHRFCWRKVVARGNDTQILCKCTLFQMLCRRGRLTELVSPKLQLVKVIKTPIPPIPQFPTRQLLNYKFLLRVWSDINSSWLCTASEVNNVRL